MLHTCLMVVRKLNFNLFSQTIPAPEEAEPAMEVSHHTCKDGPAVITASQLREIPAV